MNPVPALTLWQTDDPCPSCGGLLLAREQPGGPITHECGCGWLVTWCEDAAGGDR